MVRGTQTLGRGKSALGRARRAVRRDLRDLGRARGGLSPASPLAAHVGIDGYLRFAGARVRYLDAESAWGVARQIADGEYDLEGLRPARGDRVVDIGANIGLFALWAARRGASVRAYEPAPLTFSCLEQNVHRRPIEPHQCAVMSRPPAGGEVALWLHEERSTRHTLIGREIGDGGALNQQVSVRALGLDEVLEEGCDLLKLDCEGGEFDIILNSSPETLRQASRIILEFHRVVGSPEALVDQLRAAGFATTTHEEGGSSSSPFGVIGAVRE